MLTILVALILLVLIAKFFPAVLWWAVAVVLITVVAVALDDNVNIKEILAPIVLIGSLVATPSLIRYMAKPEKG